MKSYDAVDTYFLDVYKNIDSVTKSGADNNDKRKICADYVCSSGNLTRGDI